MESKGTVLAILNDRQLLLRADEPLDVEKKYIVFGRITIPELEKRGVPHLDLPKGEIHVVADQGNNLYVAERFKVSEQRVPYQFPGVEKGLISALVRTEVAWSAEYDERESLNFSFDRHIKSGDHIGIK
jgi:hypothetical protein